MINLNDVTALMLVKTNSPDEVGQMSMNNAGSTDEPAFVISPVKQREVEFYSEDDFEEPRRENFLNFMEQVQAVKKDLTTDTTAYFLTSIAEITGEAEKDE
ncbi:hypothetical protein [Lacticaseibacillus saniviri]